jgi:hypothetical protein
MVAIRNLYWTERIRAFIVGGLILADTLCGVVGAVPGGVSAPQVLGRCHWKLFRFINRSTQR